MEEEILDLAPIQEIVAKYSGERGALIPALQEAQELYGYLPKDVLRLLSEGLRVPLSQVFGVATFYAQFYLTKRGRHIVRQCDGTACHVRGAARIISSVERGLGIQAGETTPDYRVTYEVVYCLGSCGLAPTAVIDGNVHGHLTSENMTDLVQELR